jgi:putative transposase
MAMDEEHLLYAARYVSLNPVRARLVKRARDWAWSSVWAHLKGADDGLVTVRPLIWRVARFADLLDTPEESAEYARLQAAEKLGRPIGAPRLLKKIALKLGRSVGPRKRGRKPKETAKRRS